ncbi:uncharacterized protein LOC123552206 isoform X2 [Mercenaria mercenaria]|uniref:uncharacterized protein LOC123552206 isoform X2 n=1 Tax=Mercenaria mercenaria TaxID=6596 RepID=UPI00234E5E6D|nr:uncharacterized protein LOC123552206 isoform X2 [Mercenaria mercenaria]
MKIHQSINPNFKLLKKNKNEEVSVPVQYFSPFNKYLVDIMDILVPRERSEQSEDVNNDWTPERVQSPAPAHENRTNEQFERIIAVRNYTWLPLNELPVPKVDLSVAFVPQFEPLLSIIEQIANGTPPTPHVSMRYELLRFCTLRSYPKENKPYLIKLAEAGFYYASDGDGVVCYCCGVRRYNWVADDIPMKIHERINPNCKFLRKNEEVNVPVQYFGPFSRALMAIMDIPEPRERSGQNEDVNNDWAPERVRILAPTHQNRTNEANPLGINTAIPKHTQYATKTAREGSYSGWPDTASHTPQELAETGFFYAGFGDCVRCFYCGIGIRQWTKDDNPWIEHARWSRNCVFVKIKKGKEFVSLVQLAVQYSQDNEAQSKSIGNQLPAQEIERILLSDAAQSVLEMGYQPRIIKKAIEQILRQNGDTKITAQVLLEKVLEIEEAENPPQAASATTPPKAKPTTQTAKLKVSKSVEGAKAAAKWKTEENPVGAKTSVEEKDKGQNISLESTLEKEVQEEENSDNKVELTWLSDIEMNAAQTLLKSQFPGVNGLCNVLLFEIKQFHAHSQAFIQIYNADKNHWVVISSIGLKTGTVAVYDSFYSAISEDTFNVIRRLTNLENVNIIMPKTQKQTNANDCGLYAIAFATAILNGVDVSSLNLDPESLRLHLAKCFSQNRMELFPETKARKPSSSSSKC